MTPAISLVLVSYGSSGPAAGAAASFRAECERLGAGGEVVIVDHSGDPGEAARLGALRPDVLLARPNRGYAAGINAGVAASTAPTVLVGNPDIAFLPGAVAALLDALDAGWGVVGPQFELAGFRFPPADLQTPGEQVARWLAGRSRAAWSATFRSEVRRWRRVWEAAAPVAVPTLSGALVGFRRAAFDRVGVWDEGYFLYFEETDWVRRAARAGLRIAQVPGARVTHAYGHAVGYENIDVHFAASRARFMAAHHGWRGRIASRLPVGRTPLKPVALPPASDARPAAPRYWILSPTALGMPAWGWLGERSGLDAELAALARARPARLRYTVLVVEPEGGRVVGEYWWESCDG